MNKKPASREVLELTARAAGAELELERTRSKLVLLESSQRHLESLLEQEENSHASTRVTLSDLRARGAVSVVRGALWFAGGCALFTVLAIAIWHPKPVIVNLTQHAPADTTLSRGPRPLELVDANHPDTATVRLKSGKLLRIPATTVYPGGDRLRLDRGPDVVFIARWAEIESFTSTARQWR